MNYTLTLRQASWPNPNEEGHFNISQMFNSYDIWNKKKNLCKRSFLSSFVVCRQSLIFIYSALHVYVQLIRMSLCYKV